MLIRKAKEVEFDAIQLLRLAAYSQYKEAVPQQHWEILEGTLSSTGDRQPGVEVFIAEIDAQIAGSIVLFPSKSKAYEWDSETIEYPEIRMLAVNPDFRSKGVGKTLVRHCIEYARQQNCKLIGLHTGSFMKDAIALYEKMGFERVPALDFIPLDDGIIVKAFRFDL